MSPRSPSADFQRPASLSPQHYLSDPESCRDEASTRVHHIHPSSLSLTCNIQSEWMPLGFSLSSAPGNYSPRTSGREPVSDTDQELRLGHLHPTSNRRTHSTRATSCRTSTRQMSASLAVGCGDPPGYANDRSRQEPVRRRGPTADRRCAHRMLGRLVGIPDTREADDPRHRPGWSSLDEVRASPGSWRPTVRAADPTGRDPHV